MFYDQYATSLAVQFNIENNFLLISSKGARRCLTSIVFALIVLRDADRNRYRFGKRIMRGLEECSSLNVERCKTLTFFGCSSPRASSERTEHRSVDPDGVAARAGMTAS